MAISKPDTAFRTISEAAEAVGVPQHVLRFWETRFDQLQPLKRGGNRRYYRPADMDLLHAIRTMLHDQGLTIRGAQLALGSGAAKRVAPIGEPVVPLPQQKSAGSPDHFMLRQIRDRLRAALAA